MERSVLFRQRPEAEFYSREAMSQVAVLARIFGECRDGQIPRSSAALQI